MTLTELKSAVYRTAPDLGEFLDEGSLTQFFNECQRSLAIDSDRLTEKDIDIVDGIVTLPADCLVLKSIAWRGKELLAWPGDTLPEIRSGYPAYYFQVGDIFYLIPAPMDIGTEATIFYIARPQEMQMDTDTPSLPDTDEVLIAYALWNAFRVMGEDDQAVVWERIYQERRQAWLLVNRATNYMHTRVRMAI